MLHGCRRYDRIDIIPPSSTIIPPFAVIEQPPPSILNLGVRMRNVPKLHIHSCKTIIVSMSLLYKKIFQTFYYFRVFFSRLRGENFFMQISIQIVLFWYAKGPGLLFSIHFLPCLPGGYFDAICQPTTI